MANKIKYGLKNVHRAPITEVDGVITYGVPVPMRGAVNLSLKGLTNSTSIPADDDEEYAEITENKGYDGDVEFQVFSDQDKVDCLGATIDSNGCVVENEDDKPKPQALMFEFMGDVKATRHILYNCKFTKPDVESSTKGDKVESKTDKLAIKVRAAKDTGDIKYKTGDTTPTAIYDGWFDSVTLKNTTLSAQISPDDIVFDKKTANQADAVITIIPAASETLSTIKNGATELTLTTNYTVATNVITIKKAYLASLAVGKTNLTFEFSAGVSKNLEVTVIDTTA